MSLTTIVLPYAASNSAASFIQRSSKLNGASYVIADGNLSSPSTLEVQMTLKGPGVVGNDRFQASIKKTVLNDLNVPSVGSATITLSVPRIAEWTQDFTKDLMSAAASYLGASAAYSAISGITTTTSFPGSISSMILP